MRNFLQLWFANKSTFKFTLLKQQPVIRIRITFMCNYFILRNYKVGEQVCLTLHLNLFQRTAWYLRCSQEFMHLDILCNVAYSSQTLLTLVLSFKNRLKNFTIFSIFEIHPFQRVALC